MADVNEIKNILETSEPLDSNVEAQLEKQIEKEIELESKFGDQELAAGVEAAGRAATLGLSDYLLKKYGGETEESLKEREERSPIASTIGKITGFAGGLTSKLGTSALKASEKVAEGIIKQTGRKKAAQEVLKKTVPLAVAGAAEGSAIGVADLLNEEALGRADFNAENAIAAAKSGALLGAGTGALFGAVKASVPTVKKGAAYFTSKIKDSTKSLLDPVKASMEIVNLPISKQVKTIESTPGIANHLPKYLKKIGLEDSAEAEILNLNNKKFLQQTGRQISDNVDQLDFQIKQTGLPIPSKQIIYDDSIALVDNTLAKLNKAKDINQPAIRQLNKFKKTLEQFKTSTSENTLKDLVESRRLIGDYAFNTKFSDKIKSVSSTSRQIYNLLNKKIDDIADDVSIRSKNDNIKQVANNLKSLNIDFATGKLIEQSLAKKAIKHSSQVFQDLKDAALGYSVGETLLTGGGSIPALAAVGVGKFIRSDARRRLAILADLKKANDGVINRINSATENFFKKTEKLKNQPSLISLKSSGYALINGQQPSNKIEAFRAVADNVSELQENNDKLIKKLGSTAVRIASAAPDTATHMQATLMRAVNFLHSKLPKSNSGTSQFLFNKEYIPSELELSKFERYLQAIESPISILDDLEQGTLTREHIEAVKVVYPSIYNEIKSSVLSMIQKKPNLSYNKKIQLGILLDTPTDESLEPYAVRALQSNFNTTLEQNQQTAVKSTVSGLKNINFSNRQMTETQRITGKSE